ncbi:tyrosine-type recombinase/integrase [Variovorax sp. SRS16]|uniref:tyrosine-type recombinase/integrase n=1 Tax=Variovorax sp. SRS16 TaxID=282217 RepID=UPI001E3BDDD8|nr:tyrosine-type recombinase/integrase [Variovorax sp. SRS16]
MTIKYTYPRGGTTIYQRPVPKALHDRYPGKTIKKVLKTTDPVKVARMVADLNRQVEAEWAGLLASPESSPKALKVHADALLRSYGLAPHAPDNDPRAIELLHDHIENKLMRFAGGDERLYQDADPAEYLTAVEQEAGKRLHGKPRDTIEDALRVYLETHKKRDDKKFAIYARRAFATLTAVAGDKDIAAFTRADAHSYVKAALDNGVKTGTIRRRIGVFTAVWGAYRRERDPLRTDPFERLAIAGDGEDAKPRVPYTADQLRALYVACRAKDDERRWIIAMLIDTGCRLAEIAGLALADIKLDDEVPHVVIKPHPWRSLKNAASQRTVPLVGASLWAAQRVHERAVKGQRFAFPRYTNDTECRATAASAALVGWVRRIPIDRVLHELRHTMADRLREVQCPRAIQFAIDGHASQDVGDSYGIGYSLRVKEEWLAKVAL